MPATYYVSYLVDEDTKACQLKLYRKSYYIHEIGHNILKESVYAHDYLKDTTSLGYYLNDEYYKQFQFMRTTAFLKHTPIHILLTSLTPPEDELEDYLLMKKQDLQRSD